VVINKGDRSETHFLNVDLDIHSKADLRDLVSAFGKKVDVLFAGREDGRHSAHLELRRITKDADSAIRAFCKLIQGLPRPTRRLWDEALVREFNIGVQGASKPAKFELGIESKTLRSAADVKARIGFTIYGQLKQLRRDGSSSRPTP
jgi:hypothetical protein